MIEFIPLGNDEYTVSLQNLYSHNVNMGIIRKEYEALEPNTYYFISDGTVIKADELNAIVIKLEELNNA